MLASHHWDPKFAAWSLHVGSSWTEWSLGRFFSGFLPFSLTTNFIPHSTLISFIFVSFHLPLLWCVRRGRLASLLFTELHCISFLDLVLCRTRGDRTVVAWCWWRRRKHYNIAQELGLSPFPFSHPNVILMRSPVGVRL